MSQSKELAHTAIAMENNNEEEPLDNPSVIFKLARTHWYNDSKLRVTKPQYSQSELPAPNQAGGAGPDDENNKDHDAQYQNQTQDELVLADYSSPLLAYGVTNISFPAGSLHSSHPITVRPINATRRSQAFVQDSVSYVWDVNRTLFPGGGGVLSLYKGIGARKKIEIGRYQSDDGTFIPGGVLVIDAEEVDVLVAVLTLLSVLSQRESFAVPTGTWAGMMAV